MKKDYSFLEKYRKQYESGEIIQSYILQKEGINKNTLTKYMKNNNWNTLLAQKNHKLNIKNTLIEKIEKFKDIFEVGKIRQFEIRKAVKCDNLFLSQYISANWNKEQNTKHCISEAKKNLFKNFTAITIENQKKGVEASKKYYAKRKKQKDFLLSKKLNVGDIFYTADGIPLIFNGVRRGKKLVRNAPYSKHTYKESEILEK